MYIYFATDLKRKYRKNATPALSRFFKDCSWISWGIRCSHNNPRKYGRAQKIQDFYESSDEEIKEKQREEFDKKVLSLKQQEIDYYPDAEKIALHYNRSAHVEMINMLRFRAIIKEVVARKRYDGDQHFTSFDAIDNFREFIEEKTLQSKFN